jgi:hypothetical protein
MGWGGGSCIEYSVFLSFGGDVSVMRVRVVGAGDHLLSCLSGFCF